MKNNRPYIKNLKCILYYMEYPLLELEIKDSKLVRANNLSDGKFFPEALAINGVTYEAIRDFFCNRMIEKDSMYYKEGFVKYKESFYMLGADNHCLDVYIKNTNGNNNVDNYWVQFEGFGAQSFAQICML